MTVSERNEFRQRNTSSFRQLHNNITPTAASCTPFALYVAAHPWLLLCAFNRGIHISLPFFLFPFVLCLLVYRAFLHVSFRETIHAIFSERGILIWRMQPFAVRIGISVFVVMSLRVFACENQPVIASWKFVCAFSTACAHRIARFIFQKRSNLQ